mgnify:CR=1 FL=1
MAFGEKLQEVRKQSGMTQETFAEQLHVSRQAVSRWECGDTQPGIDALKLIAATFNVPIEKLLDMPLQAVCQSCGMPLADASLLGTEADGSPSEHHCKWCYANGAFLEDETLEELIERCAPFMAESCHITRDEAVSFMGALLPTLKRW